MNKKTTFRATLQFSSEEEDAYEQGGSCSTVLENEQTVEDVADTLEKLLQSIEINTNSKRSEWVSGKGQGQYLYSVLVKRQYLYSALVTGFSHKKATEQDIKNWREGNQRLWSRDCIISLYRIETSPMTGVLLPGTKSLGLLPFDDDDQEDLMPLEEFIDCCNDRFFWDDDGSGVYATAEGKTGLDAAPSDIINGKINRDYTHVVWYNK